MIEHIMQSMQFPAELIEKFAELSKTLQTKDKAMAIHNLQANLHNRVI